MILLSNFNASEEPKQGKRLLILKYENALLQAKRPYGTNDAKVYACKLPDVKRLHVFVLRRWFSNCQNLLHLS